MTTIAFIGLGNMGAPMARHLQSAGHSLYLFDLSASAMAAAAEQGGQITASAHEAVRHADVVISMLPASQHVEQLYLGTHGILPVIPDNALIIDCSTILPLSAQRVAQAAAERNLAMIEAPVSGGTTGAAAGTLTFIVGGEAAAVERARAILETMGKHIFHVGGHGAGQMAKLCNNMVLGIIMAATSEALAIGAAHNLDPRLLSQLMSVSTGRSWVTDVCNPWPGVKEQAPASRGYQGGFANDLMLKDLGLMMETAVSSGHPIPLGSLARNLYAMNSQLGRGRQDFSSILQLFLAE